LTSEGRLQRAHGHAEEAIVLYQKALDLQQKIGDRFGLIQTTNAMAVAYGILENHKIEIDLYEKALTKAKETGSRRIINFELANLASAYINIGRYQEAANLLEELAPKDAEYRDRRYLSLGLAYVQLGRIQDANAAFNKAIEIARPLQDWEALEQALLERSDSEDRLGNQDASLADAQESLQVLEGIRAHVVPRDFMKQGFSEVNQSAYGLYVRLLEHANRPGRALEIAEEARARAFLDLLAARDLQNKAAQDAAPDHKSTNVLEASVDKPRGRAIGADLLMRGHENENTAASQSHGADSELLSLTSAKPFALSEVQATGYDLHLDGLR
jgi:tetratricopeptide (TPR) repeat protein